MFPGQPIKNKPSSVSHSGAFTHPAGCPTIIIKCEVSCHCGLSASYSSSSKSYLCSAWSAILVLRGLTGLLGCKTLRGSSQEVMVSLDTAPAWSWSGLPWCAFFRSFKECEGCDSDLRGSDGFTSSLLLCLFTKELRALSSRATEGSGGSGWVPCSSALRLSRRLPLEE